MNLQKQNIINLLTKVTGSVKFARNMTEKVFPENSNINNRNTRGVAIRRRDAAIELTELAEKNHYGE
jgi:hypothetical protein